MNAMSHNHKGDLAAASEGSPGGARRHRLTAVYLSATERDLVVQAFDMLMSLLDTQSEHCAHSKPTRFARSYTHKRIAATQALFADKGQQ